MLLGKFKSLDSSVEFLCTWKAGHGGKFPAGLGCAVEIMLLCLPTMIVENSLIFVLLAIILSKLATSNFLDLIHDQYACGRARFRSVTLFKQTTI